MYWIHQFCDTSWQPKSALMMHTFRMSFAVNEYMIYKTKLYTRKNIQIKQIMVKLYKKYQWSSETHFGRLNACILRNIYTAVTSLHYLKTLSMAVFLLILSASMQTTTYIMNWQVSGMFTVWSSLWKQKCVENNISAYILVKLKIQYSNVCFKTLFTLPQ